jgi:hypothetical protein
MLGRRRFAMLLERDEANCHGGGEGVGPIWGVR